MPDLTKKRAIFWTRFVSWLGVGCVTPIAVFATKFGLFKASVPMTDSLGNPIQNVNITLNGWGIISCLIVGSYLANILKEIANAHTGYSLTKQVYTGFSNLMPLVVAWSVCYFLKGVLDEAMFCLMVLIMCRAASVPINPLPKWRFEKQGIEDYSDFTESLTKFVKSFKKGGGDNG